jgi:RNA polymerase sigma factor (TIGR02999 family)
MSERQLGEVTLLLQRFRQGDTEALNQLLPLVYDELRRAARHCLAAQPASWQPTALAHELLLRLLEGETYDWQNSEHFFATASLKMRNLLIDAARRKHALKHGGAWRHVSLDEAMVSITTGARLEELFAINEALDELAADHPRVAKIVEMRFFLGFNEEETASLLGLSTRQVRRDWAFAKGWFELRSRKETPPNLHPAVAD